MDQDQFVDGGPIEYASIIKLSEVQLKLEHAVDGAPSQIPTLKF